jgi:hypothetical protein
MKRKVFCIVPLRCYFIVVFSSFSFIIVLLHYYFVVTLSHCCWFVVVSSCCCSITLLLVHGYSILLFTYGSSSNRPMSPLHIPTIAMFVILSTSGTMPNPIPIRFVIVVPLCYCCSMCLVSTPQHNLLVQVAMECGIQRRSCCKL